MKILNGLKAARDIDKDTLDRIAALKGENIHPHLVIIQLGDKFDDRTYIMSEIKRAEKLDVLVDIKHLPEDVTTDDILKIIRELNKDDKVTAYAIQSQMPDSIDKSKVYHAFDKHKDIECASLKNFGKLFTDYSTIQPPTALGIMLLLKANGVELDGKNVTIVGRSTRVGKPIAALMTEQNATVTLTHSHTPHDLLKKLTNSADLVVLSTGQPKYFDHTYFNDNKNAIVIDAGIGKDEHGSLTGDVDYQDLVNSSFYDRDTMITPVPGGVGPMTITALFNQLVKMADQYK